MGSLFKKPKLPPPPKPVPLPELPPLPEPVAAPPVPDLPKADESALVREKERELLKRQRKSGRASTFLTGEDTALG